MGKEEDKTKVASRFNYRPALARAGEYLIVSSTDGLTNDLIDAIQQQAKDAVKPIAAVHTLLAADGVQLAALIQANRAAMVSQNMVEKGHTQAQAEGEVDFMKTLVEHLGHATLTGDAVDGRARLNLELKLNLP